MQTLPRHKLPLDLSVCHHLVVEVAARGAIALTVAEAILSAIRARYRAGVIEHSLARLQEVKHRAESRGAGEGGNFTGGGASHGSGGQ